MANPKHLPGLILIRRLILTVMAITVHGILLPFPPIRQQLPMPVEYLQYPIHPLYSDLTSGHGPPEVLRIYHKHRMDLFLYILIREDSHCQVLHLLLLPIIQAQAELIRL